MEKLLKIIPIPMGGLVLGMASLSVLLTGGPLQMLAALLLVLATIGCGLLLIKIIWLYSEVCDNLKNPVVASVFPTIGMAAMLLLSAWAKQLELTNHPLFKITWLIVVVGHFVWLIYFFYWQVIKQKISMKSVMPSWFIVFVGEGVVASTGMVFYPLVAKVCLLIALVFYVILLPIILVRIFKVKTFNVDQWPLVTILSAPGSLCLAGFLSVYGRKYAVVSITLLIISQLLYLVALCMIRLKFPKNFYPSYSAYTFPLVISATSLGKFTEIFLHGTRYYRFARAFCVVEQGLALLAVFFVLACYGNYLIKQIRVNKKRRSPVQ